MCVVLYFKTKTWNGQINFLSTTQTDNDELSKHSRPVQFMYHNGEWKMKSERVLKDVKVKN